MSKNRSGHGPGSTPISALPAPDPRRPAIAGQKPKRDAVRPDRQTLYNMAASRGSRVLAYVTAARQNLGTMIRQDAIRVFREVLGKAGAIEKPDLFLVRRGGLPLRRLLREFASILKSRL